MKIVKPKFPSVHVTFSGCDGNSFMMIGKVVIAMRRSGIADDDIERFKEEAKNGDYDHCIQTCMAWVEVE